MNRSDAWRTEVDFNSDNCQLCFLCFPHPQNSFYIYKEIFNSLWQVSLQNKTGTVAMLYLWIFIAFIMMALLLVLVLHNMNESAPLIVPIRRKRWFQKISLQPGLSLHGTDSDHQLALKQVRGSAELPRVTCSGTAGSACTARFGVRRSVVVWFAFHLVCLFVSEGCVVVYLDHRGIANLLTCK